MSLLGYMVVALALIIGVAIAYDLKTRRNNHGLSDEAREASRQSARRDAQDRSSPQARPSQKDVWHDGPFGGLGG